MVGAYSPSISLLLMLHHIILLSSGFETIHRENTDRWIETDKGAKREKCKENKKKIEKERVGLQEKEKRKKEQERDRKREREKE